MQGIMGHFPVLDVTQEAVVIIMAQESVGRVIIGHASKHGCVCLVVVCDITNNEEPRLFDSSQHTEWQVKQPTMFQVSW